MLGEWTVNVTAYVDVEEMTVNVTATTDVKHLYLYSPTYKELTNQIQVVSSKNVL